VTAVTPPPDPSTSTDRVAIVTGGSRCLGREVACDLARRGYAVVVDYAHDQAEADRLVDELLGCGRVATAVRGDVNDELDVERLFVEAIEAFGAVDVVVHTVGRLAVDRLAECDLVTFDDLLRTNVRGTFIVNREAGRRLRPGGAVVNLARPHPATSGAVDALTRALAGELGERRITVNTIASGPDGRAAGVVDLVAYLVGVDGHRVTGQVIRADGTGL
jgi:3-oxoacyl-[acyl-carrier protein] reductase